MLDATRSKFADRLRRLVPGRRARRFVRRQDGAAAVEFALVATPFLALTFGILESALVFFAGQTMEAAAANTARLIMTGQAQTLAYGTTNPGSYSQDDFGKAVCDQIKTLFDCTKMTVDVKQYADFTSVNNSPPITVDPVTGARNLDTSRVTYTPGGPNCIVVVTLYYQWPINVAIYGDMSNLANHKRLLVATSVFRNEPYGGANACP